MPVIADENLFRALFQWGDVKQKEEDFFSKSLVLILNRLQGSSPIQVKSFLEDLFQDTGFLVGDSSTLTINAQVSASTSERRNRPDIEFLWPTGKAFLEVKVRSGVGSDQLKNYRDVLDNDNHDGQKFLFLLTLTGFEARRKDLEGSVDKEVSWIKVWSLLRRIPDALEDNQGYVAQLVKEYCKFLEEEGMGVEPVPAIPDPGDAKNIQRYLSLIKAACEQAEFGLRHADLLLEPPEEDDFPGWMGWGFFTKRGARANQYACGFYLDDPSTLVFTVRDQAYEQSADSLPCPRWENNPEYGCADTSKQLPAEFHSYSQERQLQFVLDWLEREVRPDVDVPPEDEDEGGEE